jgi:hypothetical protein
VCVVSVEARGSFVILFVVRPMMVLGTQKRPRQRAFSVRGRT